MAHFPSCDREDEEPIDCETPNQEGRQAATTWIRPKIGFCIAAVLKGRLRVCAVQRRRFPVGESPTRQVLQPEATGATVEVTKRLKPSG